MDITPSAFDSSTLSVPVPAGSDASPNTSLPTDLLPKPSRALLGQGNVECHQGEPHAVTPRLPESVSELPAAPQPAESSRGIPAVPASLVSAEERSIPVLADRLNPKELGAGREKLPPVSLHEEEGQMGAYDKPLSLHVNSSEEEGRDSFSGLKMQKDTWELLARAKAQSPNRFIIPASSSSSVDLGGSLTRTKMADGSGDFGSVQGSGPGLQRVWSWDESLNRPNILKDTFLSKALSSAGSVRWEGTLSGDIISDEPVVPEDPRAAPQEEGLMKSTERSEPEGCNSATGVKNPALRPVPFMSITVGDLCSPRESQAASAAEPSSGTSDVTEGFQQILEKVGEARSKGAGSIHGSENGSSVDSLGIRVKSVLRREYPVTDAAPWAEGEDQDGCRQKRVHADPSLTFGRETTSVRGSENSSGDSLAARVKTLLDKEQPVMHAAQILQRAGEEERKALSK